MLEAEATAIAALTGSGGGMGSTSKWTGEDENAVATLASNGHGRANYLDDDVRGRKRARQLDFGAGGSPSVQVVSFEHLHPRIRRLMKPWK